jgi:hypothetical protein
MIDATVKFQTYSTKKKKRVEPQRRGGLKMVQALCTNPWRQKKELKLRKSDCGHIWVGMLSVCLYTHAAAAPQQTGHEAQDVGATAAILTITPTAAASLWSEPGTLFAVKLEIR